MPGVYLHCSARLESLLEGVLEITARAPVEALRPETFVVQASGLERYLALEIARRTGIAANIRFLSPQSLLERLLHYSKLERFPFDRDRATFALYHALADPPTEAIRRYLHAGKVDEPLRRYRLSVQLSRVFADYLIHRPELVAKWEAGSVDASNADEAWQADLWRAVSRPDRTATRSNSTVAGVVPSASLPERLQIFRDRIRNASAALLAEAELNERLLVFGASTLAALHRETLLELARIVDVHIFCLTPSRAVAERLLGGDSPKDAARSALLRQSAHASFEFIHVLQREIAARGLTLTYADRFAAPVSTGFLGELHRALADDESPRLLADVRPAELQIHSCHSPLREVEALREWMLERFATEPGLAASDIVVMTPDIETYAPLIEATFGSPESQELHIPYSIADAAPAAERERSAAFLAALDLKEQRFRASRVIALLESAPVRENFGLEPGAVRRFIEAASIRWGRDEADRAAADLPVGAANSWRRGVDRLLLSAILPANAADEFAGLAPCIEADGDVADSIGRLASVFRRLDQLACDVETPRTARAWREYLADFAAGFFSTDGSGSRQLETALEALATAGPEAPGGELEANAKLLPFAPVRAFLEDHMRERRSGRGFLNGTVTFCALLPMRSVPFHYVCLLGMNETNFPGRDRDPSFHLMRATPRPGDPRRAEENRLLFLETLLAANCGLYISYTGQSLRSGKRKLPPSAVVSELKSFFGKTTTALMNEREHPLQAFHPAYFVEDAQSLEGGRFGARAKSALHSYSRRLRIASEALLSAAEPAPPFIPAQTRFDVPLETEIALSDLLDFYRKPARSYCTRTLNVSPGFDQEDAADDEPIAWNALESYLARELFLESALSGLALDPAARRLRLEDRLPGGGAGELELRLAQSQAEQALREMRGRAQSGEPVQTELMADALVDGQRVSGALTELCAGDSLYILRAGRLRGEHMLAAFLKMVFLENIQSVSLFAPDEFFELRRPGNIPELRRHYVAYYNESRARPPILLLESAWNLAQLLAKGAPEAEALRRTDAALTSGFGGPRLDEYEQLLLRGRNPLREEPAAFVRVCRLVFEPLLTAVVT